MRKVFKYYVVVDKRTKRPVVGASVKVENAFKRGSGRRNTNRGGEVRLRLDHGASTFVYITKAGYHAVKDMKCGTRHTLFKYMMTPNYEPAPADPKYPGCWNGQKPIAPWDVEEDNSNDNIRDQEKAQKIAVLQEKLKNILAELYRLR